MSSHSIESHEKFIFTLEWLLAVTQRYSSGMHFGLVHINFSNPETLGDTYGAQEAAHKLDEILQSLCNGFRKTDLVTRDGVDFWVLVPYTSTDEKLDEKVTNIIEIASQCGLQVIERDISFFSLPFDLPELNRNCSAAEFLSYLKKNHIRLANHNISIPPQKNNLSEDSQE